jgi:hypothetical protein
MGRYDYCHDLHIVIPIPLHEKLLIRSKEEGYRTVSAAVRALIVEYLK